MVFDTSWYVVVTIKRVNRCDIYRVTTRLTVDKHVSLMPFKIVQDGVYAMRNVLDKHNFIGVLADELSSACPGTVQEISELEVA